MFSKCNSVDVFGGVETYFPLQSWASLFLLVLLLPKWVKKGEMSSHQYPTKQHIHSIRKTIVTTKSLTDGKLELKLYIISKDFSKNKIS